MQPERRITVDGVEYRVFDAVTRNHKLIVANPPASWADTRVFRPMEGYRRIYTFAPGEDREPTDEALARQLRRAGYLPTEQYDPSERQPR